MAFITSIDSRERSITRKGICMAYFDACCMAACRAVFSVSLLLGRLKPSMILLKARVSSSTRNNSSSFNVCPFSAQSEYSFQLSSHPLLWEERLATMVPSETPSEPTYAAIEPPPGAGDSEAVSSAKSARFISTSLAAASSSIMYSMIFSFGSKVLRSSIPIDFTAIFNNSFIETPLDRFCFSRKYFPASSMACSGISPTNSDPVTLIPRASAFLHTSSKAICTGVMLMFVRFMEIWASPYSSMNQPIAFTDFSEPGIVTALPFSSLMIFPVTEFPSRFGRPRSLTSKAMALARRVEVVFRFTLKATRKSRAPTAVTPAPALNFAGPKSGFQCGSFSFSDMPSYSPERQLARFLLSSVKAAFS